MTKIRYCDYCKNKIEVNGKYVKLTLIEKGRIVKVIGDLCLNCSSKIIKVKNE